MKRSSWIGVDVGGTFTDIVVLGEDGQPVGVAKVPTVSGDDARRSATLLVEVAGQLTGADRVTLGTTLGLNTVLERKGARCALITTRGFRDVLELRRRDRPKEARVLTFQPLVPRSLRFEVSERMGPDGSVVVPLDEEAVQSIARELPALGVEVVVVAFLHSYANGMHEERVRDVLRESGWQGSVVLSSEVAPEILEFERTSTAVVNGYILPRMGRFLEQLGSSLHEHGYGHEALMLQCNGGAMASGVARARPVTSLFSGPAGGVQAAIRAAAVNGIADCLCCDMGGTSFDVTLVRSRQPAFVEEKSIAFGIPIRVLSVDIESIGAGGGSIARVDRGGLLRVGPDSAGATPGPACYGRGGNEATVTDANLLIGRIAPEQPIGGRFGFLPDMHPAVRAVGKVASRLGVTETEAAEAIVDVVNHNMARMLRRLTMERGVDPATLTLVAYGGAGGVHATALARLLGIPRVLVPRWPGVLSALGCAEADLRYDFVQTLHVPVDRLSQRTIVDVLNAHLERGQEAVRNTGVTVRELRARFVADMAYEGQVHHLSVDLPRPDVTPEQIREPFEQAHQRLYRYRANERVVVVNLRTSVMGITPKAENGGGSSASGILREPEPVAWRRVRAHADVYTAPVYRRESLQAGVHLVGPLVVQQDDAGVIVDPGCSVRVGADGSLIVEVEG